MAKQVEVGVGVRVNLPGVTQASVAKYGVSTSQVSRRLKRRRILLEISRAGAIVAENEREKARRRMLECSVFVFRTETRPRCACFWAALEAESLGPAYTQELTTLLFT